MATSKPRVLVTLPDSTYKALKRFASASGCSMSRVVADVLVASEQSFNKVALVVESARSMEEQALASLKPALGVAESFAFGLQRSADALVDDLVELSGDGGQVASDGGQNNPRASNTGVVLDNRPKIVH